MTPQQLAVYDHVRDMLSEGGVCPSVREICDRFGYRSTSEGARVLDALVAQGRLVKTRDRVRNLALPDAASDLTRVGTSLLQAELERRGAPPVRRRRIAEMSSTRACAAAGCAERVGLGKLYCPDHWQVLPVGLRRELVEAYRAGRERDYEDAYRRATDWLSSRRAS